MQHIERWSVPLVMRVVSWFVAVMMAVVMCLAPASAEALEPAPNAPVSDAPPWRLGPLVGMYMAGMATNVVIHGVTVYVAENESPGGVVAAFGVGINFLVTVPILSAVVIDEIGDAAGYRGDYWTTYGISLVAELITLSAVAAALVSGDGDLLQGDDGTGSFLLFVFVPSATAALGGVVGYAMSRDRAAEVAARKTKRPLRRRSMSALSFAPDHGGWAWSMPVPAVAATREGLRVHVPLLEGHF